MLEMGDQVRRVHHWALSSLAVATAPASMGRTGAAEPTAKGDLPSHSFTFATYFFQHTHTHTHTLSLSLSPRHGRTHSILLLHTCQRNEEREREREREIVSQTMQHFQRLDMRSSTNYLGVLFLVA